MKIEKIIGLCYLIVTISLVGAHFFFFRFQPGEYDGIAHDVYAEDDIAYIADYNYGLVVMDASNPSNPYELGRLDQPSRYRSGIQVYVRNQIKVAFLVGDDKLRLIDVFDPSNPIQFSELDIAGDGMCVDYPFFYLYGGHRLWIYNFSNYHSPSQLSSITIEDSILGVCISEDVAYVAYGDGLKIIDVANLSNPIVLGQIGDYSYYNCVVNDATVYATTIWGDYIDIIDVTDPSNPAIINKYYVGRQSSYSLGIGFLNNTLYIPDWEYGLMFIDVTDPYNPFKFAQHRALRGRLNIHIDFPYAYITCYNSDIFPKPGLVIIDISNPSIWNEYSIINITISILSIGIVVCLIAFKLFKHKIEG